jgi:preprotein translocase subunit SecG
MPTPTQTHKHRFGAVLKKELRELIPPAIYFFIAFTLLLVTQALVEDEFGSVEALDLGKAVIGALLVGKILLIVDAFRFIDRYPDRPLIWNTLWKTAIYFVTALVFQYLEGMIPLWIDRGSLGAGSEAFFAAIRWPHFLLVQVWLLVLLFVYCAGRELFRKVGQEQVWGWFFGARRA